MVPFGNLPAVPATGPRGRLIQRLRQHPPREYHGRCQLPAGVSIVLMTSSEARIAPRGAPAPFRRPKQKPGNDHPTIVARGVWLLFAVQVQLMGSGRRSARMRNPPRGNP